MPRLPRVTRSDARVEPLKQLAAGLLHRALVVDERTP
jgi:hypothetical protein